MFDGRIVKRVDGRIVERVDGGFSERVDEEIGERINGGIGERVSEGIDVSINGEMEQEWNILAVKWTAEEGVREMASIVSRKGWYVFLVGQMCVVH